MCHQDGQDPQGFKLSAFPVLKAVGTNELKDVEALVIASSLPRELRSFLFRDIWTCQIEWWWWRSVVSFYSADWYCGQVAR
jgi:hypothetical protein